MTGLSIEADDAGSVRYGKAVSDLQSAVEVEGNAVTGTLKYVTGYTGYSSDPEDQEGNYLALAVTAAEGAEVSASIGEASVTITPDEYLVIRMTEERLEETLAFTATLNGRTETKEFDLSALVLEAE